MSVRLTTETGDAAKKSFSPPLDDYKGAADAVSSARPSYVGTSANFNPVVLRQDADRRQEIEKPHLFSMVSLGRFHGPVVRQLTDVIVPSKGNYTQYLLGVKNILALTESAMKKVLPDALPSLDSVCRTDALEKDLAALGAKDEQPFDVTQGHAAHLASIADAPHRLVAHLAVHHLGFMLGGQATSGRITGRDWGKESVALYQFPNLKPLLAAYSKELTDYMHGLSVDQYREFTQEVVTAWEFACHVEGLKTGKA